MLKFIGLILILICFSGIGLYSTKNHNIGLKQTKEMLNFMNYIKQQIEYFNTPLDEIYNSFNSTTPNFNEIVKDISSNGWTITLCNKKEIFIPQKCLSILKEFGNELGKIGKKEQIEKCTYYINAIEQEYEILKETIPQKTKTTFAIWVYIGLMIIILFL